MVKQIKTGDTNFTRLHIPPKMFVDLLKQVDINLTNYKGHIINWINTNITILVQWMKTGYSKNFTD